MSDDYSTTSDTTSDTSADTSDTSDTSSTDTVDTSDLPEDTSGSDGSEDLPETDTSDSVDTDEVTDAEEIADETDSTDDSANETSDSFSDDEVSSTDTSELSEATAGTDGSENLSDGVNERFYTEESSETDTADTPPEEVDADHSDELNDTDDVETDGAGDLDSPEKPEESDGSENLHGNDPSQEDIRDDQEVDENSDEDDGVDNLPNGCDDDLEETPDSVESDDVNDKQSDLEKGIADTVKNSGAEDPDDFSERKPIDNFEVHRNKSYANDDLGNAERKRDEAYQALLDYRNANNLGRSMEPSQEEQRLIDKANEARDKYESLRHAQELREAKFEDAIADFNPSRWSEMSQEQRENSISRLHDFCAEDLKLDNQPKITYYNGEKGDYGWSRPGEIGINRNEMGNSVETADTVAHENRHQYQSERAKNPISNEEREWCENLKPGNYIRPEDDRRGYWNQPVERDARNYAREFKERINGGRV